MTPIQDLKEKNSKLAHTSCQGRTSVHIVYMKPMDDRKRENRAWQQKPGPVANPAARTDPRRRQGDAGPKTEEENVALIDQKAYREERLLSESREVTTSRARAPHGQGRRCPDDRWPRSTELAMLPNATPEMSGGEKMLDTRRFGFGLLVALLSACLLPGLVAKAQNGDVAFQAVVGQPRGLPQLPPQGAWGEVINVTARWIVVQNHAGQQFPIAIEDIQEFLIRWPTSINALTGQSIVEAVGQTPGSNIIRAGHIDVFEGPDRTLVAPTNLEMLPNNMVVTTLDPGFNRFMNPWDYAGQNMLYGWAYPVPANISGIPSRQHVVGNVLDRNGQDQMVRVGLLGNNFATIVPDDTGQMTVTRVTRGIPALARTGDFAFMLPLQITPRGLILSQLVLYKQIPLAQFNPNANR